MHENNRENFAKICDLIRCCEPEIDSILLSMKLKLINQKFHEVIKDEKILNEIFDFLNKVALDEGEEFIQCLIIVITSKQLETFTINGKILRHAMLTICQKNFQNSDNYKKDNLQKFYNSIKLLGEFFNKSRTANGQPINILGQNLLCGLNMELEKEIRNVNHFKTEHFSRLILSQITLNGHLFKNRHKTDIDQILGTMRKCLIEIGNLSSKNRALLLMTIDLYTNNFNHLGDALENMYKGYLMDETSVKTEGGVLKTEKARARDALEKLTITTRPTSQAKKNPQVHSPKSPVKNPRSPLPRQTPPSPMQRNAIPLRNSPKYSSPQNRTANNETTRKKSSPQDLRNKNSPPKVEDANSPRRPRSHFERSPRRGEGSMHQKNRRSYTPNANFHSTKNENILKQQNPEIQTQSDPSTPVKYKSVTNKAYFREENVENLSWVSDGEFDDLDNSASPKINPYTNSFLNFLSESRK